MSNIEEVQPEAAVPEANRLPARQELRKEVIEFVKMIVWFLVLFFVVRTYVIEVYEVQGPSMIPTLQDRERILVLKLPHVLSQFRIFSGLEAIGEGDIVVFDGPGESNKRYVKRVIARGERPRGGKTADAEEQDAQTGRTYVRVRFNRGAVYVNNRRVKEDYLEEEARHSQDSLPEIRLGPGTYYVLGDNREVSKDSRSFGSITDEHVVGRAVLCFWPPSKVRLLR